MQRTTYACQGLTLDGGVVADLRRNGGLDDDDWWLAIYVMISRARTLENLLLIGFTEQVQKLLQRGPPRKFRNLSQRLETKADLTLQNLWAWPELNGLRL